ncbi:MAG: ribosomal-processing cysteine protease Prp [Clostridia bacterium]
MITVEVKRNDAGIEEITISGHANADVKGKDIVCSAVSAISFGTINSVHVLLEIMPDVQQGSKSGGYLRWRLSTDSVAETAEKEQLLAESMVIALIAVAETYGKYVTIQDAKWQGGAT